MIKTLRRVVAGKGPLMNNSTMPKVVVATVAKQALRAGQLVERAAGGYLVRGEAAMAAEVPDAVPIGLLDGSRIVRNVEKGQTLTWADVEPKQGLALEAALALRERMRGGLGVAAARD
jgi:predicted homoserine dehydrogenase-like protein